MRAGVAGLALFGMVASMGRNGAAQAAPDQAKKQCECAGRKVVGLTSGRYTAGLGVPGTCSLQPSIPCLVDTDCVNSGNAGSCQAAVQFPNGFSGADARVRGGIPEQRCLHISRNPRECARGGVRGVADERLVQRLIPWKIQRSAGTTDSRHPSGLWCVAADASYGEDAFELSRPLEVIEETVDRIRYSATTCKGPTGSGGAPRTAARSLLAWCRTQSAPRPRAANWGRRRAAFGRRPLIRSGQSPSPSIRTAFPSTSTCRAITTSNSLAPIAVHEYESTATRRSVTVPCPGSWIARKSPQVASKTTTRGEIESMCARTRVSTGAKSGSAISDRPSWGP